MTTKTVIYIGPNPVFNMSLPERQCFPKDIPVTVDSRLLNYLPEQGFEEYNPEKHKIAKNPQPILFKIPASLADALACVKAIHRVRAFYPANPIVIVGKEDWRCLLHGLTNFTIVQSYKVQPGYYFKEFQTLIPKDSPIFNGGALNVHTKEFCFLQLLRLMYGDDKKKPTLLSIPKPEPSHYTIINSGSTMGSVWTDLGDYLAKQKWNMPMQVITKQTTFHQAFEILLKTRYLLLTGDSDLAFLGTYFGVPCFAFCRDPQNVFTHQLALFNNIKPKSFIYSPFVQGKDFAIIHSKLQELIDCVLTGEPLPKEEEQRAQLDPIAVVESGKTERPRGRRTG